MDIRGLQPRSPAPGAGHPASGEAPNPVLSERSERAAAQARLEAFAAGSEPEAPPSCGTDDDDASPQSGVPGAVLFAREPSDVHEVEPTDVKQGAIADCYLMATLCALAGSPAGRDLIRRAITENKNARGETVSYTVTLHRPDAGWLRTTFTDVRVTVDATFPSRHAIPAAAPDGRAEVWPLVLEKAYAAYVGSYRAIGGHGGLPADAMRVLTGREASCIALSRTLGIPSYGATELQRDLIAGKLIVLGTGAATARADLVAKHAYWVSGTTVQNGKLYVTLHNPCNALDPAPVPVEDLDRLFTAVHVGSVR